MNSHLCGNQAVNFLLHIQRCLNLPTDLHPQKCHWQTVTCRESPECPVPCLCSARTLCGWKPEWDERPGRNPLLKHWGVPLLQAEHWGSGELSKKAADVRPSYPTISAIFTADDDVRLLWGHLTKKGAGSWRCHSLLHPCKGIRTFGSKPSSWITELTFFRVIFQLELHIFTDGLRMTVPFCSNFCCLVPKQNKKKYFKCFCKTIVTSEHPFSSQHLLWKRVAVRTQFFSLWVLHVCPKGYFTAPLKKVLSSFARLTANQKLPSYKWQVAMTSPGNQQNVDTCA